MLEATPFPQAVVKTQDFTPQMLSRLFKRAYEMKNFRGDLLRGTIMCSLFYEPSTRTKHSFESAICRLGGLPIGTENAREFSSAIKGETLEDSIKVESVYSDIIILRHTKNDAAERAARVTNKPVINAGCGTGQHPTQAFLDLFTIERKLGSIDGLKIGFWGDNKNSRVVRSNGYILGKYHKVDQHYISPQGFEPGEDMREHFAEHNIPYFLHQDINQVIGELDVLYITRVQRERMSWQARIAHRLRHNGSGYVLTKELASRMKRGALIMHPLPRVDEIATEVDTLPNAVYLREQVESGLLIRMALLAILLGK